MTKLARDVMTPDPACCTSGTSIDEVAKLMVQNDCGEIPVVDTMEEHQIRRVPVVGDDGCCAGIISQADIAREGPEQEVAELVREVSEETGRSSW